MTHPSPEAREKPTHAAQVRTMEERAREWLGKTIRKSLIAEGSGYHEIAKDLPALLTAVRNEALTEAARIALNVQPQWPRGSTDVGGEIADAIQALKSESVDDEHGR